jgi:hypothetical protein
MYLEEGDDVKFRFVSDSVIEVFESEDAELDSPVEERFGAGEEVEGTLFGVDSIKFDFQFGDGSVAFIHRDLVEVVEINDEPV